MKLSPIIGILAPVAVALFIPRAAAAADSTRPQTGTALDQDQTTDDDEKVDDGSPREVTIGKGTPSDELPTPRSDDDPHPKAASPRVPVGGVVKQAGVGGQTAYARAGVLELGGSANFVHATDFTQISLNPSFGWFFMDDIEISAIMSLSHLNGSGVDTTWVSGLIEPSIHIPFSDEVFGMLGAGVGIGYLDGPGLGFAFAPRIGLNVLVGRSGMLTPQFFMEYTTTEALVTPAGTLLAVNLSYGAGLGYTVMW